MTERIRLDDMTDDQLDQLYAELERLTIARDIAESRAEDWKQAHRVQVGLLDQATVRAEAEMANAQAAEARIEAARAHLAAAEDYVHPRHAVEDALQALTAPRP